MLSVTHSRGTPPSLAIVAYMHLTKSSVVLVFDLMKRCLREWPSVAANTLNSNSSPSRLASLIDSFQSNCSCSPGGVSKRGWGSGPADGPMEMPFLRMNCVKALYPASSSPGYLCSSHSWMPFLVTPGSCALAATSLRCASNEPALSPRPSWGRPPSALQYAATVCLSFP